MKNNTYEEQINPSVPNVKLAHSQMLLNQVGLPQWVGALLCPYCHGTLTTSSIRSISIKLNPRNIGDLCVEFLCEKCQVGNTLYFTKASPTIQDFVAYLNGAVEPSVYPITEEEMYKKNYHNVLDSIFTKKET
jgi:hypothetical protein